MDWPAFRPVTKPSYKLQTSRRNNCAEHNYNYVNGPKTTQLSKPNTQYYFFSSSQNIRQTTSNSVDIHDQSPSSQIQSEKYLFFLTK